MASVLVVLAPGAEETECIAVADVLVRAGCEVTVASAEAAPVRGSRGLMLGAHARLDDVIDDDFDCVYVPGGRGSAEYCRDDARIQALMERQLGADRLLAVICASAIALVPRGLARGRRVTSYPKVREEVVDAVGEWVDERVVIDGKLVTSQGPGTALELGLTLVRLLVDGETAAEIGRAMLVRS